MPCISRPALAVRERPRVSVRRALPPPCRGQSRTFTARRIATQQPYGAAPFWRRRSAARARCTPFVSVGARPIMRCVVYEGLAGGIDVIGAYGGVIGLSRGNRI